MQARNLLAVGRIANRPVAIPASVAGVLAGVAQRVDTQQLGHASELIPWVTVSEEDVVRVVGCVKVAGLDEAWRLRVPAWVQAPLGISCVDVSTVQDMVSELARYSGPVYIPPKSSYKLSVDLRGWPTPIVNSRASLHDHTLLSADVLTSAMRWYNSMFSGSQAVVCAHVRLGDYADPTWFSSGKSSLKLLGSVALRIKQELVATGAKSLLTDGGLDDVAVLRQALAGYSVKHGCVDVNGNACPVPNGVLEASRENFIASREQAMCALASAFVGSLQYSTFSALINDLRRITGKPPDASGLLSPPFGQANLTSVVVSRDAADSEPMGVPQSPQRVCVTVHERHGLVARVDNSTRDAVHSDVVPLIVRCDLPCDGLQLLHSAWRALHVAARASSDCAPTAVLTQLPPDHVNSKRVRGGIGGHVIPALLSLLRLPPAAAQAPTQPTCYRHAHVVPVESGSPGSSALAFQLREAVSTGMGVHTVRSVQQSSKRVLVLLPPSPIVTNADELVAFMSGSSGGLPVDVLRSGQAVDVAQALARVALVVSPLHGDHLAHVVLMPTGGCLVALVPDGAAVPGALPALAHAVNVTVVASPAVRLTQDTLRVDVSQFVDVYAPAVARLFCQLTTDPTERRAC